MKTTGHHRPPRVGVVGPCTAGKSTLLRSLKSTPEIELRHIAQEHSYVPAMWQKISDPDWLVFLDVSFPASQLRKPLNWTEAEYQEQQRRLANARQHADFYLLTDDLTPEQVAEKVLAFLRDAGLV